jgi:hypothetical protein
MLNRFRYDHGMENKVEIESLMGEESDAGLWFGDRRRSWKFYLLHRGLLFPGSTPPSRLFLERSGNVLCPRPMGVR